MRDPDQFVTQTTGEPDTLPPTRCVQCTVPVCESTQLTIPASDQRKHQIPYDHGCRNVGADFDLKDRFRTTLSLDCKQSV